jgi:hypothetical protein
MTNVCTFASRALFEGTKSGEGAIMFIRVTSYNMVICHIQRNKAKQTIKQTPILIHFNVNGKATV